jgi:hypothetical protein
METFAEFIASVDASDADAAAKTVAEAAAKAAKDAALAGQEDAHKGLGVAIKGEADGVLSDDFTRLFVPTPDGLFEVKRPRKASDTPSVAPPVAG